MSQTSIKIDPRAAVAPTAVLGEGVENKQENFAAEIAKMTEAVLNKGE